MTNADEVRTALAHYGAHTWNATTQLCECGEKFEASLTGHKLHDEHRMTKVLESVSGNQLTSDDLFNFREDLTRELRQASETIYSAKNGMEQTAQELGGKLSRSNDTMASLSMALQRAANR